MTEVNFSVMSQKYKHFCRFIEMWNHLEYDAETKIAPGFPVNSLTVSIVC